MEGLQALATMIWLAVPVVLAFGAAVTLLEPLFKWLNWVSHVLMGHDTPEQWAERRNKRNGL